MNLTAIAFLALFAAGCIASIARHPIFGLVTYITVFYVHPPSRWWGAALPELRWAYIAAAVGLVGAIVTGRGRRLLAPFSTSVMIGYLVFIAWCILQSSWAMEPELHWEMITLLIKYALVVALMHASIDSHAHLLAFLWTHVLGVAYLGWIAFTSYSGGRFEEFGGPGISEANAAAMQVVTGILVAAALLLTRPVLQRIALLPVLAFSVNALVTTISRSGFLALLVGGAVFNLLPPRLSIRKVRLYSILAGVAFLALTGPTYWSRIQSITYAGEEVQGVDTGAGRLVLMKAQWQMFLEHPLGCGHRCTATLSPQYLDAHHLSEGARSSHSTVMTLLVEQGVPGAVMYALLLLWIARSVAKLRQGARAESAVVDATITATAAALAAITVGDIFVDYLKFEARMWFVGLAIVIGSLLRVVPAESLSNHKSPLPAPSPRTSTST